VIGHAVGLYFRFHLSFRDVEELLAERGIVVSYEAVRHWCYTFGPSYAADLRRRRAQPGDKWHLDEVLLNIRGKRHWLWRAVDQNGIVLDILVQERRDQAAAERFLLRVLGSCEYEPRVLITDKLASYVPAIRRVLPSSEHRRHKRLNNRAENSHLPTRKRERVAAAVQISRARAALPGPVQCRLQPFPTPPTSAYRLHLPTDPYRATRHLARRDPGRSPPRTARRVGHSRPRPLANALGLLNLTTPEVLPSDTAAVSYFWPYVYVGIIP